MVAPARAADRQMHYVGGSDITPEYIAAPQPVPLDVKMTNTAPVKWQWHPPDSRVNRGKQLNACRMMCSALGSMCTVTGTCLVPLVTVSKG